MTPNYRRVFPALVLPLLVAALPGQYELRISEVLVDRPGRKHGHLAIRIL